VRTALAHCRSIFVPRLPPQSVGIEPGSRQRCTAKRIIPTPVLRIVLSIVHLGSFGTSCRNIQPLSLPDHTKTLACPLAALEQCCWVHCFPPFQRWIPPGTCSLGALMRRIGDPERDRVLNRYHCSPLLVRHIKRSPQVSHGLLSRCGTLISQCDLLLAL
jgi:hypothetical protein